MARSKGCCQFSSMLSAGIPFALNAADGENVLGSIEPLCSVGEVAYAQICFSYDEYPQVLCANGNAQRLLGVKGRTNARTSSSNLSLIAYASMSSLRRIARWCEQENGLQEENTYFAMPEAYLRRLDGSFVKVSSWASCVSDSRYGKVCLLCFEEMPSDCCKASGEENDFVSFMAEAFDVVFAIDYEAKTATCVRSLRSKELRVIEGVPLVLPYNYNRCVDHAVIEEDREAVKNLLDMDHPLEPGESKSITFSICYGGFSLKLGSMLLGYEGGAALLYKVLNQDRHRELPLAIDCASAYIRTIGHFGLFADGEEVGFKSAKAKAYLALLVDRRGAPVSSKEAAALLYDAVDENALTQTRKAALFMNRTLCEHGLGDIVENRKSSRRLVMDKVRCDVYDHLCDQRESKKRLNSEKYLMEYEWAEASRRALRRMDEAQNVSEAKNADDEGTCCCCG